MEPKNSFVPVRPPRIDVTPRLHEKIIESIKAGNFIVRSVEFSADGGMKADVDLTTAWRSTGKPRIYGRVTLEGFEFIQVEGNAVLCLPDEKENNAH